jgi:small-conductance mechanosensitive channel
MNLFVEFSVGPYKASMMVLVAWLFIVLITFIAHKILQRKLKRHLRKAAIEIRGTRITSLRILNQLLYVAAFILAFQAFRLNNDSISLSEFVSHNIIGPLTWGDNKSFAISFLDIIIILIIFASSKLLVNIFRLYISRRFKDNPDFDEGTQYVYVQLAKYVIYTFAIITSLQVVNVNLSVLLAGSAALLVGIGFGLQDIFRDMISGLMLLFEGTIKVGDIIRIANPNSNEPMVARVLKINVRTTKIESRDGNTLIIPNSLLTQSMVENWSFGSDLARFIIKVGVAYGSDTELVKNLLKQAALSHPEVNKSKPVIVRLIDFGDNALEMELLFWADQTWQVELHKSEIRFEIDRLFRQHNVRIPYPQRTLHIPREIKTAQRNRDTDDDTGTMNSEFF